MNKLIIWEDVSLFVGSSTQSVAQHQHPMIQLVIAQQQAFLSKQKEGWIAKKGLLIAPNYAHECDATNIPIINISIEQESLFGEWILATALKDDFVIDYPSPTMNTINFETFFPNLENSNWQAIRQMIQHVFKFKQLKSREHLQKEERIDKVLNFIREHINEPITTKKLMGVACLSESRLLHLFKEQMGLPIRNYILWYRLKMGFQFFLKGNSLTAAAYHAGFSDQSHMTRTCVKVLGVAPSVLTKNSKFIQVSFPT